MLILKCQRLLLLHKIRDISPSKIRKDYGYFLSSGENEWGSYLQKRSKMAPVKMNIDNNHLELLPKLIFHWKMYLWEIHIWDPFITGNILIRHG